ncbi:Hsp20/alpha crystallin family protein [delta proteobacterium NaphS2]|nr:Hsp20/alpha crystallin family protein [delta proteobacterium NaphS2]
MERRDLMHWRGGEISRLRNEMDQLFDRFFDWRPFALMRERDVWSPALDLAETDGTFIVTAELPGMDPKEIDISVSQNVLTLRGERKQKKEKKGKSFHRIERGYGAFSRSVQLPSDVDPEDVDATYKDGVLQLKLKKTERSAAKKIEIKAA